MGKNPSPLYTAKDKTTLVTLKIQGPKYLIRQSEPIVKTVKVTTTWQALLNDQLKLEVPLGQGIYICNPGRNRKTKPGSKWRTELNQQVRHYVNQYSRNKDFYVACIRRPDATVAAAPSKKPGPKPKSKRLQKRSTCAPQDKVLMPPPPPPPPRRQVIVPTPPPPAVASRRSSGFTEPESVASWMPAIGNIRTLSSSPEEEVDPTAGWDQEEMEVDDGVGGDIFSEVTSASEQAEELARLGITMEDIRSLVARRLERYANVMLLRMRHEMQTLIRGGTWMNIVRRAPLNANFLRDILNNYVN